MIIDERTCTIAPGRLNACPERAGAACWILKQKDRILKSIDIPPRSN